MRFYTALTNGKEQVFISFDGGVNAYRAKDLGLDQPDLNAIIRDWTPSLAAIVTTVAKTYALEPADQDHRTTAKKVGAAKTAPRLNSLAILPCPVAKLKLRAPIPRPLQDIVCLGINYDEHAKEAGGFSKEAFGGERPYTIYFSKRVSEAVATGGTIPAYTGLVDSLDYEAELGVVLGRDAKKVAPDQVHKYIFGYTVVNDVSARNLQTRHKQWYLGKSLDGFFPMGPCIVTPDEIPEVYDLTIGSTVNGEQRQHSNTHFMIQNVEGAVSELSRGMTLKAGTIIAMGTPAGVGMGFKPPKFLQPGDQVVCEIEKIGKLENVIGK
ncbi:MAG: fumarylacetoacetate hydrolase family protein [Acidaminococcaceae bacterium]|jgi:2-keto-4-pentenoate hydratase/2-oxohepta-3-ene-1,7-dioic acid hydratase in catechol pathway|nr:fumarylacetoacetate hydrolase family protein [Acidaminococcaceae bacterium]